MEICGLFKVFMLWGSLCALEAGAYILILNFITHSHASLACVRLSG